MGTINTAVQLSTVRAKIDAQQQLISRFETELQEIILGRNEVTFEAMINGYGYDGDGNIEPAGVDGTFVDPTSGDNRDGLKQILADHDGLFNAMVDGLQAFMPGGDETTLVDQTAIRQMLYQARAVLGELRVEEQQWNTEVNEEKARRKELGDFAKG